MSTTNKRTFVVFFDYCYVKTGFSQRLMQTEPKGEVVHRKSLLQQVQERGGGSSLSFNREPKPDTYCTISRGVTKGATTHPPQDDRGKGDGGCTKKIDGHGSSTWREETGHVRKGQLQGPEGSALPVPTRGRASMELEAGRMLHADGGLAGWTPPSSQYPYYKGINKGKERDGVPFLFHLTTVATCCHAMSK